jgi:hypothetical protein
VPTDAPLLAAPLRTGSTHCEDVSKAVKTGKPLWPSLRGPNPQIVNGASHNRINVAQSASFCARLKRTFMFQVTTR